MKQTKLGNKKPRYEKKLREFCREEKGLTRDDILNIGNKKELIEEAGLKTVKSKFYNSSTEFLASAFDLQYLRRTIHEPIDWDEVKELRKWGLTLSAAARKYDLVVGDKPTKTIKKKMEIEEVELPECERQIKKEYDEIKKFKQLSESLFDGEITFRQYTQELEKMWPSGTVEEIISDFKIREKADIEIKYRKQISDYKNFSGRIYEHEEEIVEVLEKDKLRMLSGFGADALYKESIVEFKKSLSYQNAPKAIVQLLYARDNLDIDVSGYGLHIYTLNVKKKNKYSNWKRYAEHFGINVFEKEENSLRKIF